MTFTTISDNHNIIDYNKWHFNRFLNPCLFDCNKRHFNRFLNPCLSRFPETCRRVNFLVFSIFDVAHDGWNFLANASCSSVSMILVFLTGASVPPDAASVLSAVPDCSLTISKSLSESLSSSSSQYIQCNQWHFNRLMKDVQKISYSTLSVKSDTLSDSSIICSQWIT